MDDSASTASLLDTFLRLSLIEGFTVDHLRRLRASGAGGFLPGMTPRGVSLLGKAKAALGSAEAGRRAEAVREACERLGIAILPWGAGDYPVALREIPGAPLLLYRAGKAWTGGDGGGRGREPRPHGTGEGIRPHPVGRARRGRMDGGQRDGARDRRGGAQGGPPRGGTTVAVLGCGVDVAYPREHAELRDEILEKGAIFSEYPPGSLPLPHRFPERNRIVSGLSPRGDRGRGAGAQRCADHREARARAGARRDGRAREPLVRPHGREQPPAAGGGDPGLLGRGRSWGPRVSASRCRRGVAERVLAALSGEMHVGEIAEAVSVPVQELLPCLMEMELANLVEKRPGNYYKKLSAPGS